VSAFVRNHHIFRIRLELLLFEVTIRTSFLEAHDMLASWTDSYMLFLETSRSRGMTLAARCFAVVSAFAMRRFHDDG
jgi:hypothetical protein